MTTDHRPDAFTIAREHDRAARRVRALAAEFSIPTLVAALLEHAMKLEAAAHSWRVVGRGVALAIGGHRA
jgi:hypothetical protein